LWSVLCLLAPNDGSLNCHFCQRKFKLAVSEQPKNQTPNHPS
jgi:hypothetical protein